MNSAFRCLCGQEGEVVVESRMVSLSHWSVEVEDRFLRCPSCGEKWYLPGWNETTQESAAKLIRQKYGLFSPDRIKLFRQRYGLSQGDLERLLGVGAKTVVRWERGLVVPGAATNKLLELIDTVPQAAKKLSEQQGVTLRENPTYVPKRPKFGAKPVSIPPGSNVYSSHDGENQRTEAAA